MIYTKHNAPSTLRNTTNYLTNKYLHREKSLVTKLKYYSAATQSQNFVKRRVPLPLPKSPSLTVQAEEQHPPVRSHNVTCELPWGNQGKSKFRSRSRLVNLSVPNCSCFWLTWPWTRSLVSTSVGGHSEQNISGCWLLFERTDFYKSSD